ncbi:MAG: M67 family peptidase [Zetaproteobacteria bacterium]|nr:MAG: M67 family peptidase [Zetaproteobacteria bacterium]
MIEPERFKSPAYLRVLDDQISELSAFIGKSVEQVMRKAAESGYPNEACGLLVGRLDDQGWHVDAAYEVRNINEDRSADRFLLDPEGYQRVDQSVRGTGQEIIGVFHSHPDCPAKPSPTDLGHAWESFLYPIVSVDRGVVHEIAYWTLNANGDRFQSVSVRML